MKFKIYLSSTYIGKREPVLIHNLKKLNFMFKDNWVVNNWVEPPIDELSGPECPTIEIKTLEELLELVDNCGKVIVHPLRGKQVYEIEIYNGYRE